MLEGKTSEQKKRLVNAISETMVQTIDVSKDKITIFINEYQYDTVAKNGIMYSDLD
jgi:4-oxalocrotonate tautomerase family enzyme